MLSETELYNIARISDENCHATHLIDNVTEIQFKNCH